MYWMSRDQRVHDNWALTHAHALAGDAGRPLGVLFCLSADYPGGTWRSFDFMLKGLRRVEEDLRELNIPFHLAVGPPADAVPRFVREHRVGRLVTDFDPLKVKRTWKQGVLASADIPVEEVDAHNVVPCWLASDREEFAAHTFRPRVRNLLPEFLQEYPPLRRRPGSFPRRKVDWEPVAASLRTDRTVRPVEWIAPGPDGARAVLDRFLDTRLHRYAGERNDPNAAAVSDLSPYLHFGQISAQRVALEVRRRFSGEPGAEAFLEELIVRRELSDNFCLYNNDYDRVEGFRPWARRTLDAHRGDPREFLYSDQQFDAAATHDGLWNAAQRQLSLAGKMAGYLRMYWAKKILEWSASPEDALATAIRLNDRYSLDGRDPNGYAGCAWSVGGTHDRAWGERPVYGKIRTMNRRGCERKFDVEAYIASVPSGGR